MGEAGPEAIMPLTRAADGSLGVRAVSSGVNTATGSGNTAITVHAPVNITQDGSAGEISNANTANTARQLEGIVQQTLTDRLRKEISPGGILYRR
jgi:phage-related minor tail protein